MKQPRTNYDLYYLTARAFTGSVATGEASLLLTGQGQGQGLQHEICSGRMKSIRELSISRAVRHEISELAVKNCTENITMKMKIKVEAKVKEETEKEEKMKGKAKAKEKEKPDLHQVELMFQEAVAGSRPPSVSAVTCITRPPSTPPQNTPKRRNEYSQLESVNLSKSVTFTCDHNTVIGYQDCSRQECDDNSTHLNKGTSVDLYDGGLRMAEANECLLASNLCDITCTEVEKLRILQLLRDHDMKDALQKEKMVLEERRWRKKHRNVSDMSSTLPIRYRPLSRFDLYHHSDRQPNPMSRPLSNPVPQSDNHPHSKSMPRLLSRPQSEPAPDTPSTLHSSLQSALLIPTSIPTPTPTPITIPIRSRAGAELLCTRKPLLAPTVSSCSKSIPPTAQDHDITPRAVQSAVDSGVDFDDSEYILSEVGNEDEHEDRDVDEHVDDEDEDCDRKVDEKRMVEEQKGGEGGMDSKAEGGKKSKGECLWDNEGQEERKFGAEEKREETVERNRSVLSFQSQSTTQSASVMGNRYSLSKQSRLIFSMVVCMFTLVCLCCVCTMWHVLCAVCCCVLCTAFCCVLCAVCCVLCAVCCVLCAVCCVLCAVCCCVQCAVCCVQCAVCCALCAVCCVQCAVRCALCAVRCVLCAVL
jgi:hypothetical protein